MFGGIQTLRADMLSKVCACKRTSRDRPEGSEAGTTWGLSLELRKKESGRKMRAVIGCSKNREGGSEKASEGKG